MKTTDEDFIKGAQEILDICRKLLDSGPTAIKRSKHAMRDGYPAQSMGGSGGKGVHDPVGELVVSPAMVDPVRQSVSQMLSALNLALKSARDAERAMHVALHQEPQPELKRESSLVDCYNCGEPAVWPDRPGPKAGRCVPCFQYKARHGVDRPKTLWDKANSA